MPATFEIQPGREEDFYDGQRRVRLLRHINPNMANVWDLTDGEKMELYQVLHQHITAQMGASVRASTRPTPCGCECTGGGFCGGCGHDGCGRR